MRTGLGILLLTTAAGLANPADPQFNGPDQVVAAANRAFGLASSERVQLVLDPETRHRDHMSIPVTVNGRPDTLVLARQSVRAAAHRVLAQVIDGTYVEMPAGPVRTYRGTLQNHPDSRVAATWLSNGWEARILLPNGEQLWLEPLAGRIAGAAAADHLLYHSEDVLARDGTCLALAVAAADDSAAATTSTQPEIAAATTVAEALLATDADYEYFQDKGSVEEVQTRIESIVNAINIQYERDVAITHLLGTMIVRTTEPDPYPSTDPTSLLREFRDHWNNDHQNVDRDTAHLFTGKDLDGTTVGLAYLGVLCSSTLSGYGYGLSQSDSSINFDYVTDLTAHELGHNWNAQHCSCPGYTMNSSLTGAKQFNPVGTIPTITAFRDSRSCLDSVDLPPAAPSDLSATAISQTAITLNWSDNASTEDGFKIERSADGVSDWTEIATVPPNTTNYTDDGLMSCDRWFYQVLAFSAAGDSDPSNVAEDRVLGNSEVCDDGVDNDCDGAVDQADTDCPSCITDSQCDDGLFCNGVETCDASGTCQAGGGDPCPSPPVKCDESLDACVGCKRDDQCADGLFCNGVETCDETGICRAGIDPCAGEGLLCTETNNSCVGCQIDADCDDGLFCNGVEICDATGNCQGGSMVICDDGLGCTADFCDETTDRCEFVPSDVSCHDNNPCTRDSCSISSGCVNSPLPAGTRCGDTGTACVNQDTCDGAGSCTDNGFVANGTVCDDGQFCTTGETCTSGVCGSGEPTNCSSLNDPCNIGVCDVGTNACVATPVNEGGACDDGDPCTLNDICAGGTCAGGNRPPELCDGLDNDCDGETDEDFPNLGNACAVGIGACETTGNLVCASAGDGTECDATPGTPAAEDATCDDVDDDCDGQTDEDYAAAATTCGTGACTAAGTTSCVDGAVQDSCTPGSPDTETCDGVDNDCNGVVDEAVCGLWELCGAVDLGQTWYWLEWFGYFNRAFDPWLYHQEHQFLLPFGEDCDSGLVYWDAGMNAFWWTASGLYPYVYRFADESWMFYERGSTAPRWFFNYQTNQWEDW